MRALCAGDLHLGAGPDYGRHPGDRLADQERVWEQVLRLAVDHDVDAVLFAGDAFHRRRPTPAELMAFQRPLQRFNVEHDIELLAINGNHDVEAGDLPSALELFAREVDLHVEPGIWPCRGAHVVTLPWTPVSRLVAQRGGGDRDDNHAAAAQLLVEIAREKRAQIDGPAVLMLHWSVSGASTPTGVMTDEFREVVLPAAELEQLGYDAIVCGHIHSAQELAPAFFYTGSPAPVDFGEARERHGVWLLDNDPQGGLPDFMAAFVPIESRPFLTINLEADEAIAVSTADTDFSVRREYADAVIRVRYRATEEQARRVDHGVIMRALYEAGCHKVFAIQADIVRENRARVDGVDEDLAPLAAVDAWVSANEISTEQSAALVDLTSRYLEEGIAA